MTADIATHAPLDVGASFVFQNVGRTRTDHDVYSGELALADLAEPLGFDSIWTTEHHFTDYMLVPDPLQFLTWMAARTTHVKLGSMVVVLPWHDPVRVAESVSMLDCMSGGRFVFGVGRGAGDVEFDGFRVPMGESRERFVEATEMILGALETGVLEYEGTHHNQPPRELRPKPPRTFRGRSYAGTLSPDAMPIMARLGLGIMIIPQKPWKQVAQELAEYREVYRSVHDDDPPSPIVSAWVYCHEDAEQAERVARHHIADYYRSTIAHYRFDSSHFAETKGYEFYARIAEKLGDDGNDKAAQDFVDLQVWGTPEQCIEKAWAIQELTGCAGVNAVFSYTGLPYGDAEESMRLFAAEVMPALQKGTR